MKFPHKTQLWLLVLVAWLTQGLQAQGQSFGLSVQPSTNQVVGTNSITYNIYLTNLAGYFLPSPAVTNSFSAQVTLASATSSQGSNYIASGNLIFGLGPMTNGGTATMTLTVIPISSGVLTNTVVAGALQATNVAGTNVVTEIYSADAELGIRLAGPIQHIYASDLTAYTITVTNSGPDAAPDVLLTNTLPASVLLISASKSYTASGSSQLFDLGAMHSGDAITVQISIQPTNANILAFTAGIGAPGILDANLANNTASTNLLISAYPASQLIAFTNSAQTINYQNGLMEQLVQVVNVGANDVPAVRVVVSGLTNRLVNAVGTNNGNPFVVYPATLAAGAKLDLLLQYINNSRTPFPFTNGQLNPFAVTVPDWTPPAVSQTSTNVNLRRIIQLSDKRMLIEFPATPGRAYTVVYSDNLAFTNARIAPPSVVAPANAVQWIDYGPPATISAVTNSPRRFYRVYQNP